MLYILIVTFLCIFFFDIFINLNRVPYTFSVTRDCELYFSVIRDSWYKSILRPRKFEFSLFVNVKSCFEFPVMCEKSK